MQKTLLSSWPLFFGVLTIMIGNGLQGSLLGLRATIEGFGTTTIGIIMSLYFLGFLISFFWTPKILENVGHIRVFAALASIASAAILIPAVIIDPVVWGITRIVTGFSYAGLYVVIESWLNGLAVKANRGRILAAYMMTNAIGMLLGQLMLNTGDPGQAELFVLTSVLVSLALTPIALTAKATPNFTAPEHIAFKALYNISPLSVAGVFMVGFVGGTVMTIGPVYAIHSGMSTAQISIFMAAAISGTVLFMYPIGIISDKLDRRLVMLICSTLSGIFFIVSYGVNGQNPHFLLMSLLLLISWGIGNAVYTLSIAHINDRISPNQFVAASSTMIFANGIGAIMGPYSTSVVMSYFGNNSFFALMGGSYILFSIYAVIRIIISDAVPVEERSPYVSMPLRSSHMIARITKKVMLRKEKELKEDCLEQK